MKRDVRIIDGVCKIVNINKNGKIVNIIGDYQKPIIAEYKIREHEESEKRRLEIEVELDKQEEEIKKRREIELDKQKKEIKKYKEKIIEDEKIYEIHNRKRREYQRRDIYIKEPDPYRKLILQNKVELGIINKAALNIKSSKELLDDWARERDFYNYEEYLNIIALGRGFTCYGEYGKVWSYYPGMPNPIKEDRTDKKFLGIYIAENGINKICEGSKRMKMNNVGYDIICPKGYKIDVKATVLNKYNDFDFAINKNNVADYFVLVGFNNIIELKPLHIWIIKSDENVYRPIKDLYRFKILNEPIYLRRYQKYERLDKLEMLRGICQDFDAKSKMDNKDYSVTNRHMIINTITQIRSEIRGNIFPTDILLILEKKKKETVYDRIKISEEEIKCMRNI